MTVQQLWDSGQRQPRESSIEGRALFTCHTCTLFSEPARSFAYAVLPTTAQCNVHACMARRAKDGGESGEGGGGEFVIDDNDAQRLQRTYSIREEVVRYGIHDSLHASIHCTSLHCGALQPGLLCSRTFACCSFTFYYTSPLRCTLSKRQTFV